MKVCVLSPGVVHAVPRTAAIAGQFDEIHFIDIIGKTSAVSLEHCGVYYHGPQNGDKDQISSRELRALLKSISPDIVVCHFAHGHHYFNAIAYSDCPVAVIAMGGDVLYEQGDNPVPFLGRLMGRMALRRSFYISAKSGYLVRRIREYGVRSPITVNYWGADLENFYPGDKCDTRKDLGWKDKGIYILSPRATEPRYNTHLIVEAFAVTLQEYPGATLVILGRAMPEYMAKVKESIRRLGLEDSVMILGEVSQEELRHYFQASDIVVSMARSEGFPNTLLEVMACKIPVVVGRIEQVEELLKDGGNASLCDMSTQGISTAISDLLGHREIAESQTQEAFATVSECADIKKNGIRFSNEIKRALSNKSNGTFMDSLIFLATYFIYRVDRKMLSHR